MATTLSKEERRSYAEMLYMRGDMEQKDIAKLVGVTERSISTWVNDPELGWKKKRKSFLVTKQEQVRRLYNIIDKLTTRIDNAEDLGDTKQADKLIKFTAALKNLETEASIAEIMEVGMLFTKYLQPISPDLALSVANHLDLFIKDRLKRF